MHACCRFGLDKLAFLISLGLANIGLAQVSSGYGPIPVNGANAVRPTNQYTMTGKLEFREHRYVLVDDSGQLEAYLVPRRTVDLKRFEGQLVEATVREPILRMGNEPRLWVDRVVPVKRSTATGAPRTLFGVASPGQIALAGHTEPVIAGDFPATTMAISNVTVSNLYGPRGRAWLNADYLLWWAKGMGIPPLVTTSPIGTPREQAGVLGEPGTRILYGNQSILESFQQGLRLRAGFWFDPDHRYGMQGEVFGLERSGAGFTASSDATGRPIVARPFFNINPRDPFTDAFDPPAREDSQLIAYPDVLNGTVAVDASTRLRSTSLALRTMLACDTSCGPRGTGYSRVDMIVGYRYLQLKERLAISDTVNSLQRAFPVSFQIQDQFETRNEFNGLDIGMAWQAGWQRWSVDLLLKTAIGSVRQKVNIQGGTTIFEADDPPVDYAGGLLALPSNIGSYSRNRFAVVPELGTNLRFAILPQLSANIGYSLIYLGSVVRPGDQIDRDINPDQLPPPIIPMAGALRPEFTYRETSYWVHGLNLGIEGRW